MIRRAIGLLALPVALALTPPMCVCLLAWALVDWGESGRRS